MSLDGHRMVKESALGSAAELLGLYMNGKQLTLGLSLCWMAVPTSSYTYQTLACSRPT